jgi:predicted NBD/HSP70 family sugar kinase
VQYFSQQAVARLLPAAGIVMPGEAPPAEKLVGVQNLMAAGDPRARRVYETIGVYLGYSIGWYAGFYEFGNLLLLGRVLSGEGGRVIAETAERVLELEFPSLREKVAIRIPDEKFKRHGQAIAAASLIAVENGRAGS